MFTDIWALQMIKHADFIPVGPSQYKKSHFVQIVTNENCFMEMKGKSLKFGHYKQNFPPRSVSSIST